MPSSDFFRSRQASTSGLTGCVAHCSRFGTAMMGSTKPDKSRSYTTAIGSATEPAAMLDVCLRRQLIAAEAHQRGDG